MPKEKFGRLLESESESSEWDQEEQSSVDALDRFVHHGPEKKEGFADKLKKKLGLDKAQKKAEGLADSAVRAKNQVAFKVTGNHSHLKKDPMTMENMSMLDAHDLEHNPELEHMAHAVEEKHGGVKGMAKQAVFDYTGVSAAQDLYSMGRGFVKSRDEHAPDEEKAFYRQQGVEGVKKFAKKGVQKAVDTVNPGIPGLSAAAGFGFDLATDSESKRRGIASSIMDRRHTDPERNEQFFAAQATNSSEKKFASAAGGSHFGEQLAMDMQVSGKKGGNTLGTAKKVLKTAQVLRDFHMNELGAGAGGGTGARAEVEADPWAWDPFGTPGSAESESQQVEEEYPFAALAQRKGK